MNQGERDKPETPAEQRARQEVEEQVKLIAAKLDKLSAMTSVLVRVVGGQGK